MLMFFSKNVEEETNTIPKEVAKTVNVLKTSLGGNLKTILVKKKVLYENKILHYLRLSLPACSISND